MSTIVEIAQLTFPISPNPCRIKDYRVVLFCNTNVIFTFSNNFSTTSSISAHLGPLISRLHSSILCMFCLNFPSQVDVQAFS